MRVIARLFIEYRARQIIDRELKSMRDTREPQAPPQGDADREPREFVTVHPDGTKEHRTTRGHRGKPLPRGNGRWQRLKLGGKR